MENIKEGGIVSIYKYKGGSCRFTVGKEYPLHSQPNDDLFILINEEKSTAGFSRERFEACFDYVGINVGGTRVSSPEVFIDGVVNTVSVPKSAQKESEDKHKGLRFNSGKIRYDLLHPIATEGIAKVMTKGSQKYAERNWEKGMKWSNVLASMKRHTAAFESGVDYDIDPECETCKESTKDNWVCKNHTGELHVDLIQTNAHFLSAYYKIYPQGDDRVHSYLKMAKIGLDIDEVLCDWVGAWTKKFGMDVPSNWHFDDSLLKRFDDMKAKGELDDFYLSLHPLIKPSDIPFEPHCYITSRPVASEVTKKWLSMFGFPSKPVYTTSSTLNKADIAKSVGLDIFVDDSFDNFTLLNNAGVCCFLMDAPHNRRYDVGYKRIKQLKDLTW